MSSPAPPPLALLAAVTAIGFCRPAHGRAGAAAARDGVRRAAPREVQLVLTLYFIGIAAGQLVYGPVSDRFGRRPVLLVRARRCFSAATVLCGAGVVAAGADRRPRAAGARRAAPGSCWAARSSATSTTARRRRAAIALVMMAMTLAPALSPGDRRLPDRVVRLAGDLRVARRCSGRWCWRSTAARLVRDASGRRCALDLARHGGVVRDAGALAAPLSLFALSQRVLERVVVHLYRQRAAICCPTALHEPPSTYGLMILMPMAAYMLGNGAAARLGRRGAAADRLFLAGLGLSALLGRDRWPCGAPARLSPWALFVPMALSSIGNGLSQPAAMAAGLSVYPRSPARRRG